MEDGVLSISNLKNTQKEKRMKKYLCIKRRPVLISSPVPGLENRCHKSRCLSFRSRKRVPRRRIHPPVRRRGQPPLPLVAHARLASRGLPPRRQVRRRKAPALWTEYPSGIFECGVRRDSGVERRSDALMSLWQLYEEKILYGGRGGAQGSLRGLPYGEERGKGTAGNGWGSLIPWLLRREWAGKGEGEGGGGRNGTRDLNSPRQWPVLKPVLKPEGTLPKGLFGGDPPPPPLLRQARKTSPPALRAKTQSGPTVALPRASHDT